MNCTDDKQHHQAGMLPPWLWFWLLLYLVILPKTIGFLWETTLQPILSPEPLPAGMGGKAVAAIQALPGIAELLPVAMLLSGVLLVLFPQWRRRYIERSYKLEPSSTTSPVLQDILATVKAYGSNIEVKTNLLRTDQFAFVYPIGYRKPAIAIFGGLVKLWRSDSEAGRAILLHELAHCRHGDVLMIGAGSFFETILNHWVRFLTLFFVFPTAFLYLWFLLGSLHEHWQLAHMLGELDSDLNAINSHLGEIGVESTGISSHSNWFVTWLLFQLKMLVTLVLPVTITSIFSLVIQTPIVIGLPLVATWCAEFNADRFVIGEQSSQEPLLRSLQAISPPLSWRTWLTSRLSHPPTRLRQWMAIRGLAPRLILTLLLLFPFAYVAKLSFMNVRVIASVALLFNASEMRQTMVEANAIGLKALAPILFGAGLVLLLYPMVAARWENLFCKTGQTLNPPFYKEYAWAAAIIGGLGLLAYGVGELMSA